MARVVRVRVRLIVRVRVSVGAGGYFPGRLSRGSPCTAIPAQSDLTHAIPQDPEQLALVLPKHCAPCMP